MTNHPKPIPGTTPDSTPIAPPFPAEDYLVRTVDKTLELVNTLMERMDRLENLVRDSPLTSTPSPTPEAPPPPVKTCSILDLPNQVVMEMSIIMETPGKAVLKVWARTDPHEAPDVDDVQYFNLVSDGCGVADVWRRMWDAAAQSLVRVKGRSIRIPWRRA